VLSAFGGGRGELCETDPPRRLLHVGGGAGCGDSGHFGPGFFGGTAAAGTLTGPCSRVDEALMLPMRQPMLDTAIEASEQPGGDVTPLRAALALLKPEKAREKLR
jgi:hypothetical protein